MHYLCHSSSFLTAPFFFLSCGSFMCRQLVAVDVSGNPRIAYARLSNLNMQTRCVACIPGNVIIVLILIIKCDDK